MGLEFAYKGYEYQDLLSAYYIIKEMFYENEAVFTIDKKESKNDKFDDLTIRTKASVIKRQIKYSENKVLNKSDLSSNSHDLALDILFNSWREIGQTSITKLRLCLAWEEPKNENILNVLDELNITDEYETGKVKYYKLNIDKLWEEAGLPNKNWKRLREQAANINRDEFADFLDNLIIEVNLPKASLDIDNPGELEILALSKLREFGIGKYPNHDKSAESVLLNLMHIVKNARANKKSLSTKEVIYRLGIQNDYGSINQEFRIEQSINIQNQDKYDNFYKILSNYHRVILLGEPGSGKSWFLQNFINYIINKDIKVIRHYCYTGINDIYERERIKVDIFLANLISDVMESYPELSKIKPTKYGVDVSELQYLLDNIDKKTLVIIDGLDHIGRIYNLHKDILREIDTQIINVIAKLKFPNNVKVVLASQPIDEVIKLKALDYYIYEIPKWEENEIISLMSKYNLENAQVRYDKKLSEVISSKSDGNPLYATYLINEIKNYSPSDINIELIEELPPYSHNLVNYYEYLMTKLREDERVAMILAGAPFYLNECELKEITGLGNYVSKSLKILKSVLRFNKFNGGYTIYHESFRRFTLERLEANEVSIEKSIYEYLINWLKEKGFYKERKAYNNLLILLFESRRYQEILEYINKDFLIESLFYGHPIGAIKRNYEILVKATCKLEDYGRLITCTEIGNMIYSLEYSFEENAEIYYKTIGCLHGYHHLKELLVYDGKMTIGYKEGLRVCYLCSKNNIIPDWDIYINSLIRNSDKHAMNGLEYFRYYICACIDKDKDFTEIINKISQRSYHKYRNVIIEEFVRRDNLESLMHIIKSLPNREWWEKSINDYTGNLEFSIDTAKTILEKIEDLKILNEGSEYLLKEFVKYVPYLISNHREIIKLFIKKIENRSWFFNWIIYVLKINEVIINGYDENIEDFEKMLVNAYNWLIKDTNPFKGKIRACDIYYGTDIIYDTIKSPLKYIKTEETWERIISIIVQLSGNTLTNLQGILMGPLTTDNLLKLFMEVINERNHKIVEESYKKVIGNEETRRYYSYLADYSMKLAILYIKAGKREQAYASFRKGIQYLLSYSFRKDRTFSRLLNCIGNIYLLDNEVGRDYVKKLKQLADSVVYHTDGRDTQSYPHEWFEELLKIDLKTSLLYLKSELVNIEYYWIYENCIESLLIYYCNQISPKIENILYRTLPSNLSDNFLKSYLNNVEWLINNDEFQLAKISISELINRFSNDGEPYIINGEIANKIRVFCHKLSIPYNNKIFKKYSKLISNKNAFDRKWIDIYNEKIAVRKSFDKMSDEELLQYIKDNEIKVSDINGLCIYFEKYQELNNKSKTFFRNIIKLHSDAYMKEKSQKNFIKIIESTKLTNAMKSFIYMTMYVTFRDGWGSRFDNIEFFKKAFEYDKTVAQECFFNYIYYNFGNIDYDLAVGDKIINSLISVGYEKEKIISYWKDLFSVINFRLSGQIDYDWETALDNKYDMTNEELLFYILLTRFKYGEATRYKWILSGIDTLLKDNSMKQKIIKSILLFIDNRDKFTDATIIFALKILKKHFSYRELVDYGLNEKLIEIYPSKNESINYLIRNMLKKAKHRIYIPIKKQEYKEKTLSVYDYLSSIDYRLKLLAEFGVDTLNIVDRFIRIINSEDYIDKCKELIVNRKYSTFIPNIYYYNCLTKCMAEEVEVFLNGCKGIINLYTLEKTLYEIVNDDLELIIAQQNSTRPRPSYLLIPEKLDEGIFEIKNDDWVIIAQYEEQCTYKREYLKLMDPNNLTRIENFSGIIFNQEELILPYLRMPYNFKLFEENICYNKYKYDFSQINFVILSNISLEYSSELSFNKKLILWMRDDVLHALNISAMHNDNGIVGLDENGDEALRFSTWQINHFYTDSSADIIPYLTGSELSIRLDKYNELCKLLRGEPKFHRILRRN